MNCHHARQLISPYLDHQLTGREMLALQDHFDLCLSCSREMQSIREVKALLRGLQEPRPPRDLSGAIALRLERAEAGPPAWRVLILPAPKPQRGRRLATALALSCLTVVSFAVPFAPDSGSAARSSASLFGSGPGSPSLAPSAPTDTLSFVREPLTDVNDDLTVLPSAAPAALPQGGTVTLTSLEVSPQPGWEMTGRGQDVSFGSAQFAVFRPR